MHNETTIDQSGTGPAQDSAETASDAMPALVARMRAGERRAIAEAVSELERLSRTAPALIAAMAPYLGHALVIGITGPPGAGKSTLVNAMIGELRGRGLSLGIIAVDPSSPISGGAILGDRLRMTASLGDDAVFMRSLASRGAVGGLSPAAVRIIDALDAAGKDVIVLETVGTGQSEIDVAEVADVRVVVAAPGLGDDIQAMKSGLLEIADILVVNKADREGAKRTAAELRAALQFRADASRETPVLETIATSGEGVAGLVERCLTEPARRGLADGRERRRKRARALLARQAAQLVTARALSTPSAAVDALCEDMLAGRLSPIEAARRLLALSD
jgi:LAO/AO transport system kinase